VLDVFHTLAEVSVAITGFSSLVIIFHGSSVDWSRQDYVNFSFALAWSIGCIFLSLLPIVLAEFTIPLASSARIGLLCAIAYMAVTSIILMRARYLVSGDDSGPVRVSASQVMEQMPWKNPMSASFFTIVGVAAAAARGWLPGPQHAWYAATIVLLMAHATAELGIFVVRTARRSDPS
jgi:hypothetical protein